MSTANNYKPVMMSVNLTAAENKLLTEASLRSRRSKSKEAELRLHDHLRHFGDIATTGRRFDHLVILK